MSYEALNALFRETQHKLVITQNELSTAHKTIEALQEVYEKSKALNEQLQAQIAELAAQPKPAPKSNPFAPTKVRSNPFQEEPEENPEEDHGFTEYGEEAVDQAEPPVEHVERVEPMEQVQPVETAEQTEPAESERTPAEPSSPRLVQPKMKLIAKTATRKRVHTSKQKRVSHTPPVIIDEWTIPDDMERHFQQMYLSNRTGKSGISNEWIYEELENEGLDEATTRDM